MQKTRHLISILLAVTIISSGLPVFHLEDVSRDGMIDLADAVMLAINSARADDQDLLYSALNVVAGLKTIITHDSDSKAAPAASYFDLPCALSILPSSIDFSRLANLSTQLYGTQQSHYHFILEPPPPPPPRTAC